MKLLGFDDDGSLRLVDVELLQQPEPPPYQYPTHLQPPWPEWEDVSGELLWGFKNAGMQYPDLGNGKYEVRALFLGKTVILTCYGEIGTNTKWPEGLEERAWWFRPLSARLQPARAAVGPLKIYFKGKGALTGGEACWELNRAAEPPYWYLILRHSTMNATGGALTAKFPAFSNTSCWALNGSNFWFQVVYEAA